MDDKAEVLYSHSSGKQFELKTNEIHGVIQAILINYKNHTLLHYFYLFKIW